jgi:hypothetical protein
VDISRMGDEDRSPHPRPATPLTFHHLVALLQQALAFAILALLLLLDVGPFFIGHQFLQTVMSRKPPTYRTDPAADIDD